MVSGRDSARAGVLADRRQRVFLLFFIECENWAMAPCGFTAAEVAKAFNIPPESVDMSRVCVTEHTVEDLDGKSHTVERIAYRQSYSRVADRAAELHNVNSAVVE